MKVICVETSIPQGFERTIYFMIKEGEVYEVVREESLLQSPLSELNPWYELIGGGRGLYPHTFFIPLSDIDETEMISEQKDKRSVATKSNQGIGR